MYVSVVLMNEIHYSHCRLHRPNQYYREERTYKTLHILKYWSEWSMFERVVLISLIIMNCALLVILLPKVSSNSQMLIRILGKSACFGEIQYFYRVDKYIFAHLRVAY